MPDPKPDWKDLVTALRNLPPWQALGDERYRDYMVRVIEPLLERCPDPEA